MNLRERKTVITKKMKKRKKERESTGRQEGRTG